MLKYLPIAAIAILFGMSNPSNDKAKPRLTMMPSAFANTAYQVQKSSISLEREDLAFQNWLRIRTTSSLSYLSGSISCNGRLIKSLGNGTTEVDLSPYLSPGKNNIFISGRYSPSNTTIEVDFSGPNHQVNQSISGSGMLNQSISIHVQ